MTVATTPPRKTPAAPSQTKSAKAMEAVRAMRRAAAASGADKITAEEIQQEIAAARRARKHAPS